MKQGIIIKSTGSWYTVKLEDGARIECRIKGKFRLDGMKLTNPVAVGDSVELEIEQDSDEDTGIIKTIHKRKNYLARKSPRRAHHLHLIACNLDQAVVIMTIKEPNLKLGFLDRFLMLTEAYSIPTHIVFNKADVLEEEDLEIYGGVKAIYEEIGYPCSLVSAIEGTGIEELKAILKDKVSLLAGHSGVGKSTLLNSIEPKLELKTADLSGYSGKGQHTTTFAEMHDLSFGGALVDSPGIKSLGFINMEQKDASHNFKEFFEASSACKFGNCLHLNEPKCAVKAAIKEGSISILRYQSYLSVMEEILGQNYWERVKDM